MELIKTADNERLLRLETEGGAAVTVAKEGESGRILSLIVPEADRRKGVGTALLLSAATILKGRGYKTLVTDYYQNEALAAFLSSLGFTIRESAPVYSVSTESILASPTVKKILKTALDGTEFLPLTDLFLVQWKELCEDLQQRDLGLTDQDMDRFLPEISGGVYDESHEPRASVFCSEIKGRGILVEFLLANDAKEPKYVFSALQGMMKAIIENGGSEAFPEIMMVVANQGVNELLKRIFPDTEDLKPIGLTCFARWEIPEAAAEHSIREEENEDAAELWKNEIEDIPFHTNLVVKLPFLRRKEERWEAVSEKKAASDVGFDKGLDQREGLMFEGTVRITGNNLEEYAEYIHPDVLQNISRPFYHGLAVRKGTEEPGALVVWEYKNLEEDRDTESEIVFYLENNSGDANTLLREYSAEIHDMESVHSFFELEEKKEGLETAGFSVKEREGRDILVSLEELSKVGPLRKKPASNVKPLKGITEKQYKRAVAGFLFRGKKGLVEDIAYLPKTWFDAEVSCCTVMDEKAEGMLLVHKTATGVLFVDFLFSAGSEYQRDLLALMRYSLRAALGKYGGDGVVLIRRHNPEVQALLNKLLPDKKGKQILFGERRES